MAVKGGAEGCCGSVLVMVSAIDDRVAQPGVGEERGELPAGESVGGVARPAVDDGGGEGWVGAVDGVHVPSRCR